MSASFRPQQAATARPQPLTRADCDLAGMSWNDSALVCEEKSGGSAQAAAPTEKPAAHSILINIDKSTQQMTVFVDGVQKYDWPVSTGKRGYSTPSGTFTAMSMNEIWYSKEWDNAPMPHAIFFMKDGHAIHGSYEVKHLGQPASHGCVRIAPQNATLLYELVKANGLPNTQVVLSGEAARVKWRVQRNRVGVKWRVRRNLGLVMVRLLPAHSSSATIIMPTPMSGLAGAAAFSGACLAVDKRCHKRRGKLHELVSFTSATDAVDGSSNRHMSSKDLGAVNAPPIRRS